MVKKSGASRSKTRSARLPKTNITVRGGIHAGRDVIMGDQYNDLRQQIAHIATPDAFIAGAQQAQAHIAALKQQPNLLPAEVRRLEVVEGDVSEAIAEAKKPKPLGERINTTLTSAKETMDKLGGSVKSAMELGTILGGLAQIALKVFGG